MDAGEFYRESAEAARLLGVRRFFSRVQKTICRRKFRLA
jgi:hypothetical protein